jgi:lipid-A-disaccharide synthase
MLRKAKRILIVAGEASADRYGARLVPAMRAISAVPLEFFGTGGDAMLDSGVRLLCHANHLANIGPREAFSQIRRYLRTFSDIVRECRRDPPAVALLLDFPDFNLRLAKKLKRDGISVIYYISPQLWAWRRGRIRTVRGYVDRMLVILPFEEDFYRRHGVAAEFVGHPILEDFAPDFDREGFVRRWNLDGGRKTIALLPGSRGKEVQYILPIMLNASVRILDRIPAQFAISVAPSLDGQLVERITSAVLTQERLRKWFRIVSAESRDILANSDFALVKSGTSTLEAALVGTPFLITYKISPASWYIGSLLIGSHFKGLVNLIAEEAIVPELLQGNATPEALAQTALRYLQDAEMADGMRSRLAGIRERLGSRRASQRVAETVNGYL